MAKTHEKLHRFGLNEREVLALNSREGEGSHREASHTSVKAPFDGAIIQYNAVEGETVAPDEVIFAVADLSTAWVIADVYEKDIPAVRQGQQAKISIESYPGVVFLGRITYVSDFLDPKTRTAKVRCEVPNRDGSLKLDMFANVQLPTSSGRRVLMVPSAAIQQVNDRPVAFVKLSETEFEMRPLQLGAPSDGWVEVASGIREGETVATHGSFFLKSTHLRSEIGGEE
jgi:cobalt-zinc-cadmium efflux system membrane fusion protein